MTSSILPSSVDAPDIVLPLAIQLQTDNSLSRAKVLGLTVTDVRNAHKVLLAAPVGTIDANTWLTHLQMTAGEYALHWLRANYNQNRKKQQRRILRQHCVS